MPSPALTPEQAERQRKAMLGNQFNKGLATEESKIKAITSYCKHLQEGYPKQAWFYRDEENNHCSWQTMDTYLKNKEFNETYVEDAKAQGMMYWFSKGKGYTDDPKTGGAQMKAWEVIMKLKYPDLFKTAEELESKTYRLTITNKSEPGLEEEA